MPCDSSYMQPREDEIASLAILTFLKETGQSPGKYDQCYGRTDTLDSDTEKLCTWCRSHQSAIPKQSLELQIWWRDHQKADVRRAKDETRSKRRRELRAKAVAKLTTAELKAILERD